MRILLVQFTVALLLFPVRRTAGAEIDHWETVVTYGSLCHYLVPQSEPDPGWYLPGFDDSGWLSGPGGVGYGDYDDPTTIDPALSVYCRYRFDIPDRGVLGELLLDVDFDDSFVAYLNGVEVGRYNLGAPGNSTAWNQPADGLHEASLFEGNLPLRLILDSAILNQVTEGENVLAIEVHNESLGSSDLSSNLYLHAGIIGNERFFSTPPYWFLPPFRSESTLLPLMVIRTGGIPIPDEPRITAHMGLIYNGPGLYNSSEDPWNEYDGQISIEIRGESSAYFYDKKSYSIETQTDSGTNNNVSLLGLPEENDFVLYGPYGDKSLIRNVLTYRLFEAFGHYSPRTRFIELIIDDDYKGLYVLTEKIKRDKNRVDIAKLTPQDTTIEDLSGGYLLRIDKTTKMAPQEYWTSIVAPPVTGYGRIIYQAFDPDYYELTDNQRLYIWAYLLKFETAMVSSDFRDPQKGYRAYLDLPSYIDLMILNEFVKDVDGFRLSHYFYKEKDTDGGHLVNGPPWDYNLTFGNSDYTEDVHRTYNWTYTLTNTIYWWARTMEDPWFRNQLYCRWDELYGSVLSSAHVNGMIDSLLLEMGEAIPRNFERWPILGVYQWPNSYVGNTYAEEEQYLRNWIDARLLWMDGQWGGLCIPVSDRSGEAIPSAPPLKVYPNPSDLSHTYFSMNLGGPATLRIRLYDMSGRMVHQSIAVYTGAEPAYALPDLSFLPDGIYNLEVTDGSAIREVCRLIKQ